MLFLLEDRFPIITLRAPRSPWREELFTRGSRTNAWWLRCTLRHRNTGIVKRWADTRAHLNPSPLFSIHHYYEDFQKILSRYYVGTVEKICSWHKVFYHENWPDYSVSADVPVWFAWQRLMRFVLKKKRKKRKNRLASLRRAPGEVHPVGICVYGAWRGRTTMGDSITINTKQTSFHSNGATLMLWKRWKWDSTEKIEGNYSPYFPPVCSEKRGLKSITPFRNYGCYW